MGDRRSLREYLRKAEGGPLKPLKPDQTIQKPPKLGTKPSTATVKTPSAQKSASMPLPKLQPLKMPDASTAALVTAVTTLITRLDRLLEKMERS